MSNGHQITTYIMENHQTEDFLLTETMQDQQTSTMTAQLATKDGLVYNFAAYGNDMLPTNITDRTGQNILRFLYNPPVYQATDTVSRIAVFQYRPGGLLANVTYGGQIIKYGYSGNNLVNVTDSAGRSIKLTYSSQNNWLLSGVTYSTGGNSTYVYGSVPIGTDAIDYRVIRQNVYTPGSVVKSSSFSYNMTDGEVRTAGIIQSDGQYTQGSTNYLFNPSSSSMTQTILNATQTQMRKSVFWYDPITGRSVQQDVYSGPTSARSFYNSQSYDSWGNIIYTRDNSGHESYLSFTNTNTQWSFQGSGSLGTATDGRLLYDDFNGPSPSVDPNAWVTGGSASSQTFNVANSLLNMTAKAATYGSWSSMWARSTSTFSYPFYAQVQMALGQNPCSYCEAAELVISPQMTSSSGDPFNNNDAIRVMIYDGVHYDIIKNVGGVQTNLYDRAAGGTWSVSWKVVLTDRNTLTVYLNRGWGGTGFVQEFTTTSLGLSANFTPAYAYLLYRTTRGNLYSASFDYVGLTSGNSVTVNNLQAGQKVQLYDWNNNLQASGTVATGQTSISLDATQMVFPYGYAQIYELDGRTVQFTSATREIYGGSTYSYIAPFKSGGTTRTTTGFLQSSTVYVDDSIPSGATAYSDGGDSWVWATSSTGPVVSGTQSHVGMAASGTHEHYFNGSTTTISPVSGQFLTQYVYIPSISVPSEIMLQFHTVGGNWEHRAYWGTNSVTACGTTGSTCGTNGTPSRLSMGSLPATRNSWTALIVKADDVGVNGLTINGWAYTLYNGGTYWDYSATGSSSIGTLTVNNLLVGQKVEDYDVTGSLKTSSTVTSGSSVTLNLYSAGINNFPLKGSLKIYATKGSLQYSSLLMIDIWGGDTYRYNQPVFSNSFNPGSPSTTIHNLPIGHAQYQNATTKPEEAYSNFDSVGDLLRIGQIHIGILLNTTYTYDSYGNPLSSVNPTSEASYMVYSPTYQGAYLTNITRILLPNTNVTTSYKYYSATGMVKTVIDPLGNQTDFQYDSINRVTLWQQQAINGTRTQVSINYYDTTNNYTITNQNGNVASYKYDKLGRTNSAQMHNGGLSSAVLASLNQTFTWQNMGRTLTTPDGNTTLFGFDYLGRPVAMINADGTNKTISYDDQNLIESTIDENGHRIANLYDPLHRLIGVREYYSGTNYYLTSYTYDGVGNLAKSVDARGQITTFTYDDLNRLTVLRYPDGNNETRTYDNVGNIQTRKDPNGSNTSYTYDSLNRLTTITYPNSTIITYNYDQNGRRTSLTYGSTSATFKYDARNRLTRETWTISGQQYSIIYNYDSVGNLIGITYPDNTNISYSLDPLNRITLVKNGGNTLANVTYVTGNRINTINYGNGVKTGYSYDSRNRPTRMKTFNNTATIMDLNYTYDATNNVIKINTESYKYDYLNRIINSTGPWGIVLYGYDAVGNRAWISQPGNTTYTYGPYNRLTWVGTSQYTYDNNGNVKTSGNSSYSYSYDYENSLTKIQQSGNTIGTYSYSPSGQRIQKIENGITTVYVNGGVDVLFEKQISGGNAVNDYVYANGLLIAKLSGTKVYYFHSDLLGSVRRVTTGSSVSFSSNYQPFGPQYAGSGTDPTYKYTGKPQDSATGLYYYSARYYDSTIGRFLSEDRNPGRISSPQSMNRYAYVNNCPCSNTDPTGEIPSFGPGSAGRLPDPSPTVAERPRGSPTLPSLNPNPPDPIIAPTPEPVAPSPARVPARPNVDPVGAWNQCAREGCPPTSGPASPANIYGGAKAQSSGDNQGQGPLNGQLDGVIKIASAFIHWSDFLSPCQQVALGAAIDIGWTAALARNPMMIVGIQAVGVAIPYLIGTVTVVEGLDRFRQTQQWDCLRGIQPWAPINPNL